MGKRFILKGADFSAVSVDNAAVSAPVFSPAAGQYQNSVSVTITSRNNATIYYTTDGTTPTTSSTMYTGAIALNTIGNTTIKAIAVKNGVQSAVATAVYEVVEQIIEPTSVSVSGVTSSTTKTVQLSATVSPSGASQSVTWQVIDGDATVSDSGLVTYDDSLAPSGDVVVRATASGHSNVYGEHTIHFAIPLAAPVISPSSGDVGDGAITVTITASSGATIRYTTDGSTPTASSTLYTGPLTISAATVLKAIAFKGTEVSDVAIGTYTIALWREGYYNFSSGVYTPNNSGRAFVCLKAGHGIKISDYTNLVVTVRPGWKVRLLFSDGADTPTSPHNANYAPETTSETTTDTLVNVNQRNTTNKQYLWLNLCKVGTVGANDYVAITNDELAAIQRGEACYWGEG